MSYALRKVLTCSDVPRLWAQGCGHLCMHKSSGVMDVLRAAGSGAVRLGKGVKSTYEKTLPASSWRDAASLSERIAERVGFFAVPAAGAYYLTRKRRGAPSAEMVPAQMAALPANYPAY